MDPEHKRQSFDIILLIHFGIVRPEARFETDCDTILDIISVQIRIRARIMLCNIIVHYCVKTIRYESVYR